MTVEQIEEKLIILLAQDVDHHFEQFARHFTPLLFQWERSKYSDTSELDTEEIVSETLIKAYHALKSYSEERIRNIKIRAWLSTILRNTSFNHRRTKWGKQ